MTLRFLLNRAMPYRGQLLAISALTLAGSFVMLAVPWLAGQFLGDILTGGSLPMEQVVLLLVAALLANGGLTIAAAMLTARTAGRVLADLRLETYAHVQSLPLGYHDRNRQGDMLALMSFEVSHLSQFLTATLSGVPAMLVTALGSVVLLYLIDPIIAVFVPILVPVFYLFLKVVGRRLRLLATHARDAEARLMSAAEEDLEMLPAIKAFAVERRRLASYEDLAEKAFDLAFRTARIRAFVGPVIAVVAALAAIALLIAVDARADAAGTTPAELFSLLLYAALLTRPVAALADLYGNFQWASGTLTRLASVLDLPREPGLDAGEKVTRSRGAISFEGLHFAYPGREDVLAGCDFAIRAGEVVALTGLNGAGKSTLINLLTRFYEPGGGRIMLDGCDIAHLQVQSLRRQIGLVPQSPLMFNDTIRANITLGKPDASAAEIAEALRLAQADEFIAHLPDGLETEIGDHGVRLSGGQRQRVALARALLPDPPILVFDEATAMYDLAGEDAFVAACQTALKDRTVIIITHRRASLALADRIFRIEQGRAIETAPS